MEIDLKTDIKRTTQYLNGIHRQVVPKATLRALNRTGTSVKTAVTKHVSKESGIAVTVVRKHTDVIKANRTALRVIVIGRKRAFNLIRFVTQAQRRRKTTNKQGGLKANPWRRKRFFKGMFVIKGKAHGQPVVVIRDGSKVRGAYGPNLNVEFDKPQSRALMGRTARARFLVNFNADLKYYLSRQPK